MKPSNQAIVLTATEVAQLEQMLSKGKHGVRSLKRAGVLLALHAGKKPAIVAKESGLSLATVYNIANRYRQEGKLQEALEEKPRPGQPSKFDKATEAHLTVLACSEPPEGHSRWTFRLLADKLIELRIVDTISHQAVGERLKKISSNPG
jgi:putative transposase